MVQVARTCPMGQVRASNECRRGACRWEQHLEKARRSRDRMKNKDKSRKWMWWLLGSITALQAYFVRELLAAFALFALGFVAVAVLIGSLYVLQRVWAASVERVADSRHPVMVAVRHGIDSVEDLARRPFRRPGPAQPAN